MTHNLNKYVRVRHNNNKEKNGKVKKEGGTKNKKKNES